MRRVRMFVSVVAVLTAMPLVLPLSAYPGRALRFANLGGCLRFGCRRGEVYNIKSAGSVEVVVDGNPVDGVSNTAQVRVFRQLNSDCLEDIAIDFFTTGVVGYPGISVGPQILFLKSSSLRYLLNTSASATQPVIRTGKEHADQRGGTEVMPSTIFARHKSKG